MKYDVNCQILGPDNKPVRDDAGFQHQTITVEAEGGDDAADKAYRTATTSGISVIIRGVNPSPVVDEPVIEKARSK